MIRHSQQEIVHPYGEMAMSVGLRLGKPLDVSDGINYFPLAASDHQCIRKSYGLHFARPLPNACKLEGDLQKFFLSNGSCSLWVSHK